MHADEQTTLPATQDEPPPSDRPVVAAFDFDGTLTQRDSLLPFLWHVAGGPLRFAWTALRLAPTLAAFKLGMLRNDVAKARVLAAFLAGCPQEKAEALGEHFAATGVPRLLRPEAVARLRWHQRQGHCTVLVSASVALYLRPWAEAMGFDAAVTTRLAVREGRLTGGFEGLNCYGLEKVRRLKACMPTLGLPLSEERSGDLGACTLYAYGDSAGDRDLLAAADYPFLRKFSSSHAYKAHEA